MTTMVNRKTLDCISKEFIRTEDFEKLKYSLGGIMYTPAHNSKISDFLIRKKYPHLRSLAICLEDAIADGSEKEAMLNLQKNFDELSDAVDAGIISAEKLPYIFVRVKYHKQMEQVYSLIKRPELLTGFIFPKFDIHNAQIFLKSLSDINQSADNIIYAMPILESTVVSDIRNRIFVLSEIKTMLDNYKKYILNIRIGGNDFCNKFGVRRKITDSIYDIHVVSGIISDIVNIFSEEYVVSAPVWEYFENADDPSDTAWSDGLKNEISKDILNGLFGKTAVHPSQLAVINSELAVSYQDYNDALGILRWQDSDLAVSKSFSGNRMNEQKVHGNWAKKILIRASVYGVDDIERKEYN